MGAWRPRLVAGRPLYLALADALARDVTEGRLTTGTRLPTQRELAEALGVTVGTVTRGYVEAARLSGTPHLAVAWRHVVPNITPVVGVQVSVSIGIAILAEAGLSYLGLGSGPEAPTWGRMLRDAQAYIFNAPQLALWPGLAIAVTTMGFNLLGDGLRDLLDPRLREIR